VRATRGDDLQDMGSEMGWQEEWVERFYRSRPGFVNGTQEFWDLCSAHVPRGAEILEIGAGPTNKTSSFLSTMGQVDGVDVDPDARTNSHLRRAYVVEDERFPCSDASYDACVSNFVLEHVQSPSLHLSEVKRVLRPGGVYVFRTPNRWHYVALVSNLTPHWFHELVANRLRRLPHAAHDPYPTYYRLNTRRAVEHEARAAGLEAVDVRTIEKEPSYGMSSRALFLAFMAYERVVNATDACADLRANILAVLRKPGP
jgi:SAM-dependent methyltransferase